jgi:hypothetical protein
MSFLQVIFIIKGIALVGPCTKEERTCPPFLKNDPGDRDYSIE